MNVLLTQQGFCHSWGTRVPLCLARGNLSLLPVRVRQHWRSCFLQRKRPSCEIVGAPGDSGVADHVSQAAQEADKESVCLFSVQPPSLLNERD